jgi:hypothetical protein
MKHSKRPALVDKSVTDFEVSNVQKPTVFRSAKRRSWPFSDIRRCSTEVRNAHHYGHGLIRDGVREACALGAMTRCTPITRKVSDATFFWLAIVGAMLVAVMGRHMSVCFRATVSRNRAAASLS